MGEFPDASYDVPLPRTSSLNKLHNKFQPELANTDIDLANIIQRLSFVGEREGLTFCFYGASGTGKTEYARYIAQQLKMASITVHSSDIMYSKYGMTERVLQRLFDKAKAEKACLIFDEADSFLYSRKSVNKTWEAALVNEFLRLFEEHTQPIICTTNCLEELDKAFMRRLMFKVKFNPLTVEQSESAFKHFFGIDIPSYIKKFPFLTLGDMGLVYKKAKVLGYLYEPNELCKLFYQDALAKHSANSVSNTRAKRIAK